MTLLLLIHLNLEVGLFDVLFKTKLAYNPFFTVSCPGSFGFSS